MFGYVYICETFCLHASCSISSGTNKYVPPPALYEKPDKAVRCGCCLSPEMNILVIPTPKNDN